MTATEPKTGGLAKLKRRVKVGTRLLCVRNTYRPELNGTEREVIRVLTVAFVWKVPGSEKDKSSWTHYPKARELAWVDDDTFRLRLFDEHYVELKFLPESPAVAAIGATVEDARRWLDDARAAYKAEKWDDVLRLCDTYFRWRNSGNPKFNVTADGTTFDSDHTATTYNNFSSAMKRGPVD